MPNIIGSIFTCNKCSCIDSDDDNKEEMCDKKLKKELTVINKKINNFDIVINKVKTDLEVISVKLEALDEKQKEYHDHLREVKDDLRDDIKYLRSYLSLNIIKK